MDKERKKELREEFMNLKTYMGVIQIKNNKNGKVYIMTTPNLKNQWLTVKAQLDMGTHANATLQKEWKKMGEDVFSYEVLEEKEVEETTDRKWELKQLEKKWLEKLEPYDERGYHIKKTL